MTDKKTLILDICIPYCIKPEKYSGRLQVTGSNAEKDAYLDALQRELKSCADELEDYTIKAVRVGGGAATVMNPDLLGTTIAMVRKLLPVEHSAELGFDALPNTIGTPSLTGIALGRPTRAELMMNSESDGELKTLDCSFKHQDTKNALLFFNRFRLNNVSATVMCGIPGQTGESWKKTLDFCTRSGLSHVHVTLPEGIPAGEDCFEKYRFAHECLTAAGFLNYGAGLFCRPGFENMFEVYKRDGADILALGAGAVSCMDGYAVRNTNNTAVYINHAGDFEKTTAAVYELDTEAFMLRYAAGRLTLCEGLKDELFRSRFGSEPGERLLKILSGLESAGLVLRRDDSWVPTERGLFDLKAVNNAFVNA